MYVMNTEKNPHIEYDPYGDPGSTNHRPGWQGERSPNVSGEMGGLGPEQHSVNQVPSPPER